QKELFRPSGLQSYERGALDFSLERAVLVQSTEAENEDLLRKKAQRAVTLVDDVDHDERLTIAGYSEEQITEIKARKDKENEIVTDDDPDSTTEDTEDTEAGDV